ncbi:hypothetical protein HDV05_006350 [Chytridiales sp. JEL 0842]|nr:hypothetical protein HDV05_006350 [Chytridiales sp. JEL 0842]
MSSSTTTTTVVSCPAASVPCGPLCVPTNSICCTPRTAQNQTTAATLQLSYTCPTNFVCGASLNSSFTDPNACCPPSTTFSIRLNSCVNANNVTQPGQVGDRTSILPVPGVNYGAIWTSAGTLQPWFIAVIAVSGVLVLGFIVCAIMCCCGACSILKKPSRLRKREGEIRPLGGIQSVSVVEAPTQPGSTYRYGGDPVQNHLSDSYGGGRVGGNSKGRDQHMYGN